MFWHRWNYALQARGRVVGRIFFEYMGYGNDFDGGCGIGVRGWLVERGFTRWRMYEVEIDWRLGEEVRFLMNFLHSL